jgi:hypothetical protein
LDKFDEALTSIERSHECGDLYFEKAYCQYRLNKVEEAYDTLLKCETMGVKEKELLAQVVRQFCLFLSKILISNKYFIFFSIHFDMIGLQIRKIPGKLRRLSRSHQKR